MDEEQSSTSVESDYIPTFADWFLEQPGRAIYIPVPTTFVEDEFNLYDVHSMPNFEAILEIVLEDEPPHQDILADASFLENLLTFYELVHQKYITTKTGLHEMYGKFIKGEFGKCPRALCNGEYALPLGLHTQPRVSNLKLYCPHCQDIYLPPSRRQARLDGCGFGPSFAHLLIMQYREKLPTWNHIEQQWLHYEPHIYGFRINQKSPMAPQMSQLRQSPDGYR